MCSSSFSLWQWYWRWRWCELQQSRLADSAADDAVSETSSVSSGGYSRCSNYVSMVCCSVCGFSRSVGNRIEWQMWHVASLFHVTVSRSLWLSTVDIQAYTQLTHTYLVLPVLIIFNCSIRDEFSLDQQLHVYPLHLRRYMTFAWPW